MLRHEFFYCVCPDVPERKPRTHETEILNDNERLLQTIFAPDPVTGQPCPAHALTIPSDHPEYFNIVSKLYNALPRQSGCDNYEDAESLITSRYLQYGEELDHVARELEQIIKDDSQPENIDSQPDTNTES